VALDSSAIAAPASAAPWNAAISPLPAEAITAPAMAVAISPPARAIALLKPEAVPLWLSSTVASTAVVSGAATLDMPMAMTSVPGNTELQ
jgi:hypothetical protein